MAEIYIELQEYQNEIKKKLKRAFSKIDEDKSMQVKKEIFFQMLEVLDVKLPIKDTLLLSRKFEKNGLIPYLDALRYLNLSQKTGDWELLKQNRLSVPIEYSRNALQQTISPNRGDYEEDVKSITPSVFDNRKSARLNRNLNRLADTKSIKSNDSKSRHSRACSNVGSVALSLGKMSLKASTVFNEMNMLKTVV